MAYSNTGTLQDPVVCNLIWKKTDKVTGQEIYYTCLSMRDVENASLIKAGIVMLSNSLESVSEVTAPTSKAIKQVWDKAVDAYDIAVREASLTQMGQVMLSNDTDSVSVTTAPTSLALHNVKSSLDTRVSSLEINQGTSFDSIEDIQNTVETNTDRITDIEEVLIKLVSVEEQEPEDLTDMATNSMLIYPSIDLLN